MAGVLKGGMLPEGIPVGDAVGKLNPGGEKEGEPALGAVYDGILAEGTENEFEGCPVGNPLGNPTPGCEKEGGPTDDALRDGNPPEESEIEFEGNPVGSPLGKPIPGKEGRLKPDALADAKGTDDTSI